AVQIDAVSNARAPEQSELEATAREISAVFRKAPEIDRSSVTVKYTNTVTRYVNSEGTSFVRGEPLIGVEVNAQTEAADGQPITDSFTVRARDTASLPARDALRARAEAMSARLVKLREAASVDRYNGPVLFEGQAAGEIFVQKIGSRLASSRKPVSDN